MKKLITLSIILFALNANCQLKPIASIEIGTNQRTLTFIRSNSGSKNFFTHPKITFYSNINIGINYKKFYISSNIITNFSKSDFEKQTFNPFYAEYYFDFFYKFKKFKIGYQHYCAHPILYNLSSFHSIDNYIIDSWDKFYIKFQITN